MLITIEKLKELYSDKDFSKYSDERLAMKLGAIETSVREHTHNPFINRHTITECFSKNDCVYGDFQYFKLGDTVNVYSSGVNNGLYTILEKHDDYIVLDKEVYDSDSMKLAKVEYPLEIIDGCVELLDYELNYKDKLKSGISSESISRHSVSYVQMNNSNSLNGYPIHLLGFLKKYVNWRT